MFLQGHKTQKLKKKKRKENDMKWKHFYTLLHTPFQWQPKVVLLYQVLNNFIFTFFFFLYLDRLT